MVSDQTMFSIYVQEACSFFKRETVEELVWEEAGTRRSGRKGKIGQNVMYERRVKV